MPECASLCQNRDCYGRYSSFSDSNMSLNQEEQRDVMSLNIQNRISLLPRRQFEHRRRSSRTRYIYAVIIIYYSNYSPELLTIIKTKIMSIIVNIIILHINQHRMTIIKAILKLMMLHLQRSNISLLLLILIYLQFMIRYNLEFSYLYHIWINSIFILIQLFDIF